MRSLLIIAVAIPAVLYGNNLEISGLEMEGQDRISFEISWENSWNYADSTAPHNHDAVWLFCKGRLLSDGSWEPVRFAMSGHVTGGLLNARTAAAGTGIMLSRANKGDGEILPASMELQLDATDPALIYDAIRVFGIEMVYIPQGGHYVGDSLSNNCLVAYGSNDPYLIDSELAIEAGTEEGNLWSSGDFPPGGDIPAAFPKGYSGIYSMRYEISQIQYCEFLNTLTPSQKAVNRLSTLVEAPCFGSDHLDGERNFIVEADGVFGCDASGNGILNETFDGCETACNFLTWSQFTAYLDWCGLRPMTELEYEKICRGGADPVPLEFAWGNPDIVNTNYVSDEATDTEHTLDTIPAGYGIGNYGYCSPSGPLRTGFAGYSATSRSTSGASYYGVMEMSGNVWELCVVLTAGGLDFEGRHGDGAIGPDGYENAWNWSAEAGGHRGGAWNSGILDGFRDLAVSDRFFVYLDPDQLARGTAGGRGVISQSMFE